MRNSLVRGLLSWMTFIAVFGTIGGCERDIPFVTPSEESIQGYQLEGYVTDRFGMPAKGVPVRVFYEYDPLDDNPPQSQTYLVVDSTRTIVVKVLNQNNNELRTLFAGRKSVGPMSVSWDQLDASGKPAPSGVYVVNYSIGGSVVFTYPVVVDGAVSAITDSMGHYVIPNLNLPVGFFPAPLYASDNSSYLGNYSITSTVVLELDLAVVSSAEVTLTKDQVTRFDFRL